MVKKFTPVLILSIVLSIASIGFSSPASAEGWTYFGPYKYATNDGRWDGQLYVNNGGDVHVITQEPVNVRLCNANTGNCTSVKSTRYGAGVASYYNMTGGKYYGDVLSTTPYQFKGTIKFSVYNK